MNNKIKLRHYQHKAILDTTTKVSENHSKIVICVPTGGGKTAIANELIRKTVENGNKCLFISHSAEINAQTSRKLTDLGVDHAFIQAGRKRVESQVQIAMVQSLAKRDKPEAHLIVIDECHLSLAKTYLDIIEHYKNSIVIGLTATPERLSGEPLSDIYSAIVKVISVKELIAEGSLVKPRTFITNTPDISALRIIRGEYDERESAKLLNQTAVVSNIVENWQVHAVDRMTICFAINVLHSRAITKQFNDAGILARHVDGTTPQLERDAILESWRNGEFLVLCNVNLYVAGLDAPEISCVLLARPTASVTVFLQSVGRGLRPADNKTDCLIMDCASLSETHGFAQDDRNWTLDGKVKKPRQELEGGGLHPILLT